jgi:hypothetical protein
MIEDVLDNRRQWWVECGDSLESLRRMPSGLGYW